MNYSYELIKKAYKKLKCNLYFDKTQLLLRQQLVEFEDGDIEVKLQKIYDALTNENEWEQLQKEIIESISFKVFPKSLVKPEKRKHTCHEAQEDEKDVLLVTNRVPEETQIDQLQYFINMRVEGHVLGVLWLLAIGWKLDKELYENSYGNRLRKQITQELEKENGEISYSPYLFEPYFQQYESWRDSALELAQDSINRNQDVIVFTMDLMRFYYSVDINDEAFDGIWNDVTGEQNEEDECAKRLNEFVRKVISGYSEYYFDGQKDRNILPIGFLPSNVLGNWCLKKFDKAISDGWNPLYFGRYVDDIIIVDKVEKNSALYDMMNQDVVDANGVLQYCLSQCSRWNGPLQREDCNEYALFRYDKVESASNKKGQYILNSRYNVTENSNSKICLQNEKVKMFYFKHGESNALLQCFRKQITENVSEFRFMPEDEAVFDANDYSEIYDIDNKESINKFRGVEGISINKFALSKMLGKYMRVSSLINDKVENRFAQDIAKIYTPRVIVENYITWEKVIEIFVVNSQWKALGVFMENILLAVDRIKYEEEAQKEADIRKNLKEYLYTAWVRALSLVWGTDVKRHIETVVMKFLKNSKREEDVRKDRRRYLTTRMYDKYVVPVLLDVLGEKWAEDADDTEEICLYNFSDVLQQAAKMESDTDTAYSFFPYMVTMYDLYIRSLVLKLRGTEKEKKDFDITSVKTDYVKINFNVKNAVIDNAVRSMKTGIGGSKPVTVISVGTMRQGKMDIAVANIKMEGSNFERLVKGKPNRSYKRYAALSHIVNSAIAEKADMLVLPEACVPIEWLPALIRTCTKNDMALVTGVEHIVFDEKVYNYTAVALPYEEVGYRCAVLSFHLKNHYAPFEADLIQGYRLQEVRGNGYELYHWKDCWFPVYCCYELASIGDRTMFSAYADVLAAVEWNKDVNYYSNILESLSRDLHCHCVQVNSSDYGDSRITMPSRTEAKDIIKTKGGNNAAILVGTVDFGKLRDFQLKEYNLQKMSKEYKPTPPEFDKKVVAWKIQGKLEDELTKYSEEI